MTVIAGTQIGAPIVPTDTGDTFPTHNPQYGLGGYRSVDLLTDRYSIPANRLEEGMMVYVKEDQGTYQLLPGATYPTDSGDWQLLDVGTAPTLMLAYNGGGLGLGRTITANNGAVEIVVPDNANNSALRLENNDITNDPNTLEIVDVTLGNSISLSKTVNSSANGIGLLVDVTNAGSGLGYGIYVATGETYIGGRLAVGGDATIGKNGSYDKLWNFAATITDFSSSTSWNGFRGIFTINSGVNLTGGAATYIAGWNFESKIASGNDKNYEFNTSVYAGAFHSGTGTVSNQAAWASVSQGLGSGSITNNLGGESVATHSGTGSITTNYGHYFYTGHEGSGGSITTDYTIYIAVPAHARPITSHYGIYIEDQNFGTTNYSIYTNAGKVRFGDDFQSIGRVAIGNGGTFGLNSSYDKVFDFNHTITDFSSGANWSPFQLTVNIDPTVDLGSTFIYNRFINKILSSNTHNIHYVEAFSPTFTHSGSGTVDLGVACRPIASVGNGVVSVMGAIDGLSEVTGTGSITDNYGISVQTGHAGSGGSITNDYTFYVYVPLASRPITNHYGLYIEDQENVNITNAYAIYTKNGLVHLGDDIEGLGHVAFGADATLGVVSGETKLFDFEETIMDFSAASNWSGLKTTLTINPNANLTGVNIKGIYANDFRVATAGANANDLDNFYGIYGEAYHDGTGTVTNLYGVAFQIATQGGGNVTNMTGLYIRSQCVSNATVTNNYGYSIGSGVTTAGGTITNDYSLYVYAPASTGTLTTHYGIYLENQNFGTTAYALYTNTGVVRFGDNMSIVQPVYTSGSPSILTITGGAHTTLTASTEVIDLNINLSRTVQLATGALTTQRSVVVSPVTYGFVGASTVSFSSTFAVTGLPQAGTNATLTNSSALIVGDLNGYASPAGGAVGLAVVMPGITNGTGATSTLSGLAFLAVGSVNLSNQTATTTNVSMVNLQGITFVSTTNVRTVTNLSTLYIQSAPTASTNVTVTAGGGPFSLFVDAGAIRFDDQVQWGAGVAVTAGNYSVGRDADATNQLHFNVPTGSGFEFSINDVAYAVFGATASTISQVAATSGSPTLLTVTGAAHTTLAASTEATDLNFNLARTVQFAQGALTNQRAVRFQAPTYSFSGTSTLTNACTVDISGPPSSGNASTTILNPASLRVGSGNATYSSNASFAYSNVNLLANTITLTGTTQVTSAPGIANLRVGIVTVTDSSSVTVDAAASVYIAGAPAQGGSVTITNSYSLWVDAGLVRFDGGLDMQNSVISNIGNAGTDFNSSGGLTLASTLTISAGGLAHVAGNIGFFNATPAAQQAGVENITNSVASGGVDGTIANYTDLSTYSNDATTIRNNIYQLARSLAQVKNAMRTYGLLS